ncbi:MAG: glycoside hydrolase family protein [Bacteroidota bacterium]
MPNPVSGFWQFIGVAVEDPGYHVWGSSPIYDDSGKVHVFAARWPDSISFDRGWRTHSEIAHYVAGSPEGPFTFKDLVLAPTGKNSWDKMGMHNPNIQKVKDQYVLTYISNDGLEHHPANQRIGMVLSASLYGPWRKVGKDGMILEPPSNPGYWNYNPGNGVNNPAFLAHPNGGFFLYFKSQKNGVSTMGLAIAENVEGPYVQLPVPITKNKTVIEDGYAFHYKDRFYLMTTDNHGIIEEGGGLLWSSRDGINFDAPVQTFRPIKNYLPTKQIPKGATFHYGGMVGKFERPQLLIDENGCPEYLYVPSGTNLYGGKGTVSYVLKRSNTIKPKN